MKTKFPFWVLALIVSLIGVMNGAASYWHLYYHYHWLDIPMHLAGGLWVGLSALAIYYFTPIVAEKKHTVRTVIFIAIFSALIIGIGWEAFEWVVDQMTGLKHVDIIDTLSDIMNDLIGATVAAVIFIKKRYNN